MDPHATEHTSEELDAPPVETNNLVRDGEPQSIARVALFEPHATLPQLSYFFVTQAHAIVVNIDDNDRSSGAARDANAGGCPLAGILEDDTDEFHEIVFVQIDVNFFDQFDLPRQLLLNLSEDRHATQDRLIQ
jgi:hypothetical protein